MIHFCYDTIDYPNLAKPGLTVRDFDETWPRSIPFRPLFFFQLAGIDYQTHTVDQAPIGSWYPIGIGWHDFGCDYFGMMSTLLLTRLRQREIRVLFYYHEGDNPERIRVRFDSLCEQHQLPVDCYCFISANTAANSVERFVYFPDHEYFTRYINRFQPSIKPTAQSRSHRFTALNRTHKWWRASCMCDLLADGILDERSYWSYNTTCTVDDRPEDNPLRVHESPSWTDCLQVFLANGPYWCDTNNDQAHNNHRQINTDLYTNSYCHIILETFFDVDQSGGSFLTEKTYKCIKYGQPFVIAGAHGSLQELRDLGYRVFDHAIDNSYDLIVDNTERWFALKRAIKQIHSQDMHTWYMRCLPDLIHNQQLFCQTGAPGLKGLIDLISVA